ncbi:MAG: sigma-70 family RNA polymerase sigma factor [Actinomycetota bacterium]|nr:sigma-70 family RNA polymerase sigma factor [Actinomycetota bacterium]
MWSLSDEALLAGMRSGDPESAAGFVRRYQSRVYGLVLTVLGDRALAEEAAQETFLKAWRHADAYDPRRGQVSTWLLAIARNTAVDVARLKRADPLDPQELVALCERDDATDPDDPFVMAVELHRLRGAIRELPEEQKIALMQAAFYGRTAREISELQGVPLGTVKTRIRSALLKLRSSLEVSDEL